MLQLSNIYIPGNKCNNMDQNNDNFIVFVCRCRRHRICWVNTIPLRSLFHVVAELWSTAIGDKISVYVCAVHCAFTINQTCPSAPTATPCSRTNRQNQLLLCCMRSTPLNWIWCMWIVCWFGEFVVRRFGAISHLNVFECRCRTCCRRMSTNFWQIKLLKT